LDIGYATPLIAAERAPPNQPLQQTAATPEYRAIVKRRGDGGGHE
jgi:hypothetical protein